MTVSQLLDSASVPTLINATVHPTDDTWAGDQSSISVDDEKPDSTKGPLSEKYVSFSSWVDVVAVPHINDFEPEDVENLWLSQRDFDKIKMEAKQTVQFKVKYGLVDDNLEFSSRGLETKVEQEQRRRDQKEAVDAVLNEQYLQRVEGNVLPELIAMLYSVFSFPCRQEAHLVAGRDALDVDETYYGGDCELDSEMPYPGQSLLEKIAEDENLSGEEAFSSIEQWLVERFQRGERLVKVRRVRQYTMAQADVE